MLEPLMPLVGTWTGEGLATYPTMEDTAYRERLTIQPDEKGSLLQYEQKTWRAATGLQSHWEFGFIIPQEDGSLEIVNTQSGGRVEALAGRVQSTGGGVKLILSSTLEGNDPRMVASDRQISVEGDTLRYELVMSTQTTPNLTLHLKAELAREAT